MTRLALVVVLLASPALGADYYAAEAAYLRRDYATAAREFRALAEEGDPAAQHMLAFMYVFGYGVPKDDVEAVRWTRRAAEPSPPLGAGSISPLRGR